MNQATRIALGITLAACLSAPVGYWFGLQDATFADMRHSVTVEEAFRAGYVMRACNGGNLNQTLVSPECKEWARAFYLDHNETAQREGVPA